MHRTSDRSRVRRDGNTHADGDRAEHPRGDQLSYTRTDFTVDDDPAPDPDEGARRRDADTWRSDAHAEHRDTDTRRDAGPAEPDPEPDVLADVGRGVLPLARYRPDTPSPGSP
ncbi:hypothetical protein AB0G54_29810 [Streptomyces yokosukanensis]|uniref:hypothetical protein n=1 Tax=Streptomyces yokosukanensis TaxID=67386 RepID=UPI00344615EC